MILNFRFRTWESGVFGLPLPPMSARDKKLHVLAGSVALAVAVLWFAIGTALAAPGSRMMFLMVELPVTGLAVFGGIALVIVYGMVPRE